MKRYFALFLLVAMSRVSWGFSLLGPLPPDAGGEPWQVDTIGYAQPYYLSGYPGGLVWLGDIGGPHNIGEEYRRNAPVLYYSYDPSFLDGNYFGTNGTAAIDSAFAIMNSLTNVDNYSLDLSEFPLSSQHYNYTAQSLYLTDLKSTTLHLLVEQLGLADPARYSWTLHTRYQSPVPCPVGTFYLVVQRNFDGTSEPDLQTLAYSPYVNDELLSYYITEHCTGPPPALATTVPFMTDPSGADFAPVAANNAQQLEEDDTSIEWHLPTIYGLQIGGYYSGLTRDDVAGLRYLFSTNNINLEPIPATSLLFNVNTNFSLQQLFPNGNGTNNAGTNAGFYFYDGTYGYGDYGWLVATSQTNSPAVLQTMYPGLVIASSSNYFVLSSNVTYTQYFTNSGYGTTYPPPLQLVTVTNYTPFLLQKYVTLFANVFPNHFYSNTIAYLQTISVVPNIKAPYGSPPVTNVTTQTIVYTNAPSGDFFLLSMFHTNVCPLDFLYTGLTNVLAITNFLTAASTNVVASTNTSGSTNTSSYSSTLSQINYFTNYTWVTHPVNCAEVTNAPNLYQGIGGVKFVRADYDSELGQYFQPVTNYYTMLAVTNSQLQLQHLVRVVTAPDILLTAADSALGPADIPFNNTVERNINFNSSQEIAGLRGPGIIDITSTFIYNKVGPIFENGPFLDANSFINPNEVNETTQLPLLQWASFDGTTNDPVVYPNGTSVQNLESQMLIQLTTTPSGPLVGTNGTPYSVQFSATGGAFDYSPAPTWTASGISGVVGSGLPPGLSLSSAGILSGTPTSSGTFDFILQMTDALARTVQWTFSITIN
jgi:hypothetical protein